MSPPPRDPMHRRTKSEPILPSMIRRDVPRNSSEASTTTSSASTGPSTNATTPNATPSAAAPGPVVTPPPVASPSPEDKSNDEEDPDVIIIYEPRTNYGKGDAKNHRPVAPGVTFLLKDNPDVDWECAKKGVVNIKKTHILLLGTNKKRYKHIYTDATAADWNNQKWITDLNKWRRQALRRHFHKDPDRRIPTPRLKWSQSEHDFVSAKIKETGKEKLTRKDFDEIAKLHKKQFHGTEVKVGEAMYDGVPLKKAHVIGARTAAAIQTMFTSERCKKRGADGDLKNSDLVNTDGGNDSDDIVMEEAGVEGVEAVAENDGVEEESSDEDDDDRAPKKIKLDHGGEIDHGLEDPSDDEDEGRRPASQQNGARLVDVHG